MMTMLMMVMIHRAWSLDDELGDDAAVRPSLKSLAALVQVSDNVALLMKVQTLVLEKLRRR